MKRIAYLIPAFPVFSETFVGTEIRAMERRGHSVLPVAFARPEGPVQPQDEPLARRTRYVGELGLAAALTTLPHLRPSLLRALAFVWRQQGLGRLSLLYSAARIAGLLAREGVEHIHAHFAQGTAASAIVAARLLGIGVSFVGHGFDVYAHPYDLPLKLSEADFAVAVCRDMQLDFSAQAADCRVELVYCGIEPERFGRPRHDADNGRLLFIGRLTDSKGVSDLLHALALIPAAQRPGLDLVGEGQQLPELLMLTRALGLTADVTFLGRRPSTWIARHGPAYRALVGPFKPGRNGTRDTGPVVVKEAMAMGLPVITSDFMGCKEMVDTSCGLRVPVGDVPALATAILTLGQLDSRERRRMGEAGHRRVLKLFTADAQAAHLSRLVEGL